MTHLKQFAGCVVNSTYIAASRVALTGSTTRNTQYIHRSSIRHIVVYFLHNIRINSLLYNTSFNVFQPLIYVVTTVQQNIAAEGAIVDGKVEVDNVLE